MLGIAAAEGTAGRRGHVPTAPGRPLFFVPPVPAWHAAILTSPNRPTPAVRRPRAGAPTLIPARALTRCLQQSYVRPSTPQYGSAVTPAGGAPAYSPRILTLAVRRPRRHAAKVPKRCLWSGWRYGPAALPERRRLGRRSTGCRRYAQPGYAIRTPGLRIRPPALQAPPAAVTLQGGAEGGYAPHALPAWLQRRLRL